MAFWYHSFPLWYVSSLEIKHKQEQNVFFTWEFALQSFQGTLEFLVSSTQCSYVMFATFLSKCLASLTKYFFACARNFVNVSSYGLQTYKEIYTNGFTASDLSTAQQLQNIEQCYVKWVKHKGSSALWNMRFVFG